MKALYVADARAVAALFLPDERNRSLRDIFQALGDDEILAPSLFWHEISNVIHGAQKKGRLTEAEALSLWPALSAIGLRIDDRSGPGYAGELCQSAGAHGLSSYDASYFELAARRGATLVSLDEDLRKAASGAGTAPPAQCPSCVRPGGMGPEASRLVLRLRCFRRSFLAFSNFFSSTDTVTSLLGLP